MASPACSNPAVNLHKYIYHPKGRPLLDTAPDNANPGQNHFPSLSKVALARHHKMLPYRRAAGAALPTYNQFDLTLGSATLQEEKRLFGFDLGEVRWFVCTLAFPLPRRNPTELSHSRPTGRYYQLFVAGLCSSALSMTPDVLLNSLIRAVQSFLFTEPEPFINAQQSIRLSAKQVSNLRVRRPEFG